MPTLSKFFALNEDAAMIEWLCFHNYLMKHKKETRGYVLKSLLASDVGNSYPQLYQLAGIVLACPVGIAGKVSYNLQFYREYIAFYITLHYITS